MNLIRLSELKQAVQDNNGNYSRLRSHSHVTDVEWFSLQLQHFHRNKFIAAYAKESSQDGTHETSSFISSITWR